MIRITARPARGIWRCGIHHPPELVLFPDSYFSATEMDRLLADPDLVVMVDETDEGDRSHLGIIEGGAPAGGAPAGGASSSAPPATPAPATTDRPAERSAQERAETIEIPPVAELEALLATITDQDVVFHLRMRDHRKTAEALYVARMAELATGATS